MRLFGSLDGYQRPWLGGDLIAGLTLWAILVPQALAYASIANVSPVVGLYAAPGALLLYAALGSSRVLVMGPMAAAAALSAATVADLAPVGDQAFARAHRRPGHNGRRRRPDRGPAAPRLPGRVHQPSRAQGPDHRPRAHDHHRPTAEAARDQRRARRLLRADLAPRHPPRRHTGPDTARRHLHASRDPRPAPPRPRRSRPARGRRRRAGSTAPIRPSQQRADGGTSAPRQLLC